MQIAIHWVTQPDIANALTLEITNKNKTEILSDFIA